MSFRPLHDRILVRRVESEEKTRGGIIIPDTAKEKPQEGEAASVAGLLVTTEAMIAEKPKKDAVPAVPAGAGMDF
ncbi:hypothetical protein HFO55_32675 [Rhizobium leguminosarum]|nr:hypothetical protein [Rhizobium leguminosarum]MBY5578426.1 hypothetical protein [Rhizobium leguminosarum]MBY5585112.1 hypothetical protein [Rhizobium leguminosarum]